MAKEIGLFLADTHLCRRMWAGYPIEGDSYYAFEQAVDYAVNEGDIEFFVLAGDGIDARKNEPSPIVFLNDQLRRLADAGVKFAYIQGQHEQDPTPWYGVNKDAQHFHQRTIRIGDFRVYGLDFLPRGELQDELDGIPKGVDLLVAHQVWADWMGDITNPQGEFADIPRVERLFTGDLHEQRMEKHMGRDGQEIMVVSPGSTCLTDISHQKDKYVYAFDSDGGFSKVLLKCRPFDLWQINDNDTLEAHLDDLERTLDSLWADDSLPDYIQKPIIRVVYSYKATDAVRRITRLVDGRAHLFWKELPRPIEESSLAAKAKRMVEQSTSGALTLESALPQEVDQEKNPKIYALCERMLAAGASKEEVEIAMTKWVKEEIGESEQPVAS